MAKLLEFTEGFGTADTANRCEPLGPVVCGKIGTEPKVELAVDVPSLAAGEAGAGVGADLSSTPAQSPSEPAGPFAWARNRAELGRDKKPEESNPYLMAQMTALQREIRAALDAAMGVSDQFHFRTAFGGGADLSGSGPGAGGSTYPAHLDNAALDADCTASRSFFLGGDAAAERHELVFIQTARLLT